jgi:hypothetical protein
LRKADIDKFDRTSNIPRHKIREMLRNSNFQWTLKNKWRFLYDINI